MSVLQKSILANDFDIIVLSFVEFDSFNENYKIFEEKNEIKIKR